ncbi:MAG: protein translocase subunit SecF [Pseudomonadota bacterium]
MQLIKPGTDYNFTGRVPLFGGISIGLVLLSLVGIATRGFNWGIDFAGGTELQVRFDSAVATTDIRRVLGEQGFDKNEVQPYGAVESHEFLVRIERVTSLGEDRVARLREEALKHFGAETLHAFVFEPSEGDRVALDFALPPITAPAVEDAGVSADAAVQGEQLARARAQRDEKSVAELTVKVQDFFKAQGIELRAHDFIQFGQVRGDKVEALIYFKGVADRIVQSMTKAFGPACTAENAADVCKASNRCDSGKCAIDNRRTDYVDSNVSKELRTTGLLAIIYALLGILLYIAVRFDFYFSPGAVVAVIHDVTITMGIFAWLGLEFNLTTIAALLTIVGYSLNDTIVVYDRIRETLPTDDKLKEDRASYVNRAINDTLSRTILTSGTTMLVVVALLIFATGVIQMFAVAMAIGITVGTYSSIYVASPVYLILKKMVPAPR